MTARSTDPWQTGQIYLAQALFGKEAVDAVKAKNIPIREIWELSSPTTQCENTIGKVTSHTKCWICGLSINKFNLGMTEECEHILPIAQAVIFLRLYNNGHKTIRASTNDSEKKMLELEYGWAHVVCNQEKSDLCPFRLTRENILKINKGDISNLLRKIYYSTRSDSANLKKALEGLYPTVEEFIAARLPSIEQRYTHIKTYIERGDPGSVGLTVLAGLEGARDLDYIHTKVHTIISPAALELARHALNDRVQREIRQELGLDVIDGLGGLTSILGVYNEVGAKIKVILDGIRGIFQSQVRYREFFGELGISPEYYENIQRIVEGIEQDSFTFVIKIYPEIYQATPNREATYQAIGDFLVYKFVENIRDNAMAAEAAMPRNFLYELMSIITDIKERLKRQYPTEILDRLNRKYNEYHDSVAAESLVELSDLADAAGLLASFIPDHAERGRMAQTHINRGSGTRSRSRSRSRRSNANRAAGGSNANNRGTRNRRHY